MNCQIGKRGLGHAVQVWSLEAALTGAKPDNSEVIPDEVSETAVSSHRVAGKSDDAAGGGAEPPRLSHLCVFMARDGDADGNRWAKGAVHLASPENRPRASDARALHHPGAPVEGDLETLEGTKRLYDASVGSDSELLTPGNVAQRGQSSDVLAAFSTGPHHPAALGLLALAGHGHQSRARAGHRAGVPWARSIPPWVSGSSARGATGQVRAPLGSSGATCPSWALAEASGTKHLLAAVAQSWQKVPTGVSQVSA